MTDTVIPVSLPHPITPYADGDAYTPPVTEDDYYPADEDEIAPATTNTCPLCGYWKFSVMAICAPCNEHLQTGGAHAPTDAWDDAEALEDQMALIHAEIAAEDCEEYICRGCGMSYLDDDPSDGFCSPQCAAGKSCYCCYH